jgi:release factor glutamine methyltransferase
MMKQTINYIHDSLSGLYNPLEIDSFISLIFNSLFGYSKKELILNANQIIPETDLQKIKGIISRLENFEPIQYILGETEFYGLKFKVGPGVLIPRFETEEMVDLIIKRKQKTTCKILDIGTGSGCIAIALKKQLPESEVWCCDISEKALEITRENAFLNTVKLVIEKFDILGQENFPVDGFDIIVSNPPYVTDNEKSAMEKNVLNFEPELALFVPNDDPILFYRAIVFKFKKLFAFRGELFFEINEAFGKHISTLLVENGFVVEILKDINGKDRFVVASLK